MSSPVQQEEYSINSTFSLDKNQKQLMSYLPELTSSNKVLSKLLEMPPTCRILKSKVN